MTALLCMAKKKIEKSRALTLEKMILIFSHRNMVLNCVYWLIHWSTVNFISVHTSKCPIFFRTSRSSRYLNGGPRVTNESDFPIIANHSLFLSSTGSLTSQTWLQRQMPTTFNQTYYFESPLLAWTLDQLYRVKATAIKENII